MNDHGGDDTASSAIITVLAAILVAATMLVAPNSGGPAVDRENPVARAGPDVMIEQGDTINFDGSASSDNNKIDSWNWSFFYDGVPVLTEGMKFSFTFEHSGDYVVILRVTDPANNVGFDDLLIVVSDSSA